VFILENKINTLSVQKNLCQNVLYHVGNCVSLCQYGEGFLLVYQAQASFLLKSSQTLLRIKYMTYFIRSPPKHH
jgi:hypothetical protein